YIYKPNTKYPKKKKFVFFLPGLKKNNPRGGAPPGGGAPHPTIASFTYGYLLIRQMLFFKGFNENLAVARTVCQAHGSRTNVIITTDKHS
ncbi:MAG: hypothetical protein ACFB8W_03545, partial [Elainellaceae cyanobacterium]